MKSMSIHWAVLPILLALSCKDAPALATDEVVLTVTTDKAEYQQIEDIVLNIRVRNTTSHELSFQTMVQEPPILLALFDDRGRNRVVNGPKTGLKDRTTRNREYTLKPEESRTYKLPVSSLLGRDQSLAHFGPGVLRVVVSLPRVTYSEGHYSVQLFEAELDHIGLTK